MTGEQTAKGADDSGRPIWSKPLYRHWFLFLLTFTYALNFLDRQLLSILAEPIKLELGLSDAQLGALGGIYFALFYATLGVPIARISDRTDRINILSGAITLWSAATAACGLAQNFVHLVLARISVAVGEAAATPPSYSMIADIFARQERASAIGVFTTGTAIGVAAGLALGGWVGAMFGWRTAFLMIGLPGVILAIVIRSTLRDPPRGFSDGIASDENKAGIWETVKLLASRTAFRGIALGTGVASISGYALAFWIPSFMVRSYDMSIAEAGWRVALAAGVGGIAGGFFGGFVSDWLSKYDRRWWAWAPAICFLLNVPVMILLFLSSSPIFALLLLATAQFLYHFWGGSGHAIVQSLVGKRMRAMAASIFLLCINLIGLGLGPFAVGWLSDAMAMWQGEESLRFALMATTPVWILAGILYAVAASKLREDLDSAPD